MSEIHAAISKQQPVHTEAAFIVAGDFNHSNLKTVLAKFYQHVSCHTRGDNTGQCVYNCNSFSDNIFYSVIYSILFYSIEYSILFLLSYSTPVFLLL